MRASSICKIVHYVLFILFFAIGIYEYHRLEILAAQVQWVVDPFTGTRIPGPGYEEVMREKVRALKILLPLLGAVFLTERRFWIAIGWLRDIRNINDKHNTVRLVVGGLVLVFLLLYIVLTVKFELVAMGV